MQLTLFNTPVATHFFLPCTCLPSLRTPLLSSSPSLSSTFSISQTCLTPTINPHCLGLSLENTDLPSLRSTHLYLTTSTDSTHIAKMSSRRSRSRQSGSSRITDEQISDLVSKLQDLLPEARLRGNDRVPSSRVLQETCSYIRSLHREVDDLSERLSELLATSDMSTAQAAVIRSLLM